MNYLLVLLAVAKLASPQRLGLDIYWIDVEGGAATLIVTPAGESILVDAGENVEGGTQPDRDALRIYDVAASVAHLKQIDHLVVTHFHSDHMGGVIKLSHLMPIQHFYDHGTTDLSTSDIDHTKLMPLYQRVSRGRARHLKPGDRLELRQARDAPRVVVECIASDGKAGPVPPKPSPNPVCAGKQAAPEDSTDNAKSVVLLLKYGDFTFFDGGDLTWQKEAALVCPTNRVGTVELMQIDHHGLDLSNNPVLIESLKPRVVVVNNGPTKGAEPGTMRTLKSVSSIETVWQIHRNMKTGPELNTDPRFIANQSAECTVEFIKASASPDGTFSVQIGPRGTAQSYSLAKTE